MEIEIEERHTVHSRERHPMLPYGRLLQSLRFPLAEGPAMFWSCWLSGCPE